MKNSDGVFLEERNPDREEFRLFFDIVQRSTNGVYVIERESHKIKYANDAMNKIFAKEGIGDFLGKPCFSAFRRGEKPCKDCFLSATKRGEHYITLFSKTYSGASHSVEWDGIPSEVIYLSDISEEKKAQLELGKTQQKLTAAIDHAGLAYWEYDVLGDRAYLNSISTSEYTLDEVLENYPASLYETGAICKEHIPLYDSLVQAVRKGVPTASADIKTMDAKGDLVWKRVRFTTLFDEENRPFWAIATAESINEYKALENQYSTVLEQNNIESWMYDLERHTIILSNKAKGFYGLQATEIPDMPEFLIGRNLFHPEDYGKIREFYAKLHQGENFVSEIFRVREVETGDFVWRRCTYTVLPRRNGEPLYALGSSVDVTDQMEAKRKYEDAMKYRYSTLEENVLLAGHCNVTRNVMLEVEDRTGFGLEHRFGRAREDFYRGIASLIPNEEEKETFCKTFLNENIKKSFDLGITQHTYECAVSLGKEQNIRWLSTRIDTALQPETGDLIGFLKVTDVSAGKMQEQVLESVIAFDYDYVAHLNFHGDTMAFYSGKNQNARRRKYKYGVSYSYSEEIRRVAREEVVEGEKRVYRKRMYSKYVVRQLERRDSYEFTYHLRTDAGEIRTKQARFAVYDRAAGIVVFSRTDVTEMLAQQEKQKIALSESLAIARQANSAKSKFLASMSHDIRTPMNAIVGMCNLAIADEENSEQVHESLQVIQQSSGLLLSIITDILDMNRIESGKMVLTRDTFSVSKQMQLAVGRARALASKKQQRVELEMDIIHDSCSGDIVRIHRIIDNVLANSLKFTGEGGMIRYNISESEMENKNIGLYRFEIKDNGIGMSTEQQSHIFEPFYRANNPMLSQVEGTGLGLAIVKSIVDYMGGTLSVHSVLEEGTTFVIELPLRIAEEIAPTEKAEKTQAANFHLAGIRVLLCEDHPTNQLVAKRILEKEGILVTLAKNGEIGYHTFAESAPGFFHAILMDIQMPVMNGYQATRAIRECGHRQAKTIPILAMTANAFAEDVQKSIKAGMNGHLAKPIAPKELYETLARILE